MTGDDDLDLSGSTPAEVVAAGLPPLPHPAAFDVDTLTAWFAATDPVRRALRTDRTWRAYAGDLAHYGTWCAATAHTPLPATADTVADYLTDHAEDLSVATLGRRLAAVSVAHGLIGVPSPTDSEAVALVWRGLRRVHGPGRPSHRVDALETPTLMTLLAPLQDTVMDHRDRALLVLGFAGALRRSEVSALDLGDVQVHRDVDLNTDSLVVTVAATPTREGRLVTLPWGSRRETCPVRSWRAWIEGAGISGEEPDRPAFRRMTKGGRSLRHDRLGDRGVAEVVKRRAAEAGLDPRLFSGHSLRAGFVTAASRAGVPGAAIARQTGHRSAAALAACVREDRPFAQNPAGRVGL